MRLSIRAADRWNPLAHTHQVRCLFSLRIFCDQNLFPHVFSEYPALFSTALSSRYVCMYCDASQVPKDNNRPTTATSYRNSGSLMPENRRKASSRYAAEERPMSAWLNNESKRYGKTYVTCLKTWLAFKLYIGHVVHIPCSAS